MQHVVDLVSFLTARSLSTQSPNSKGGLFISRPVELPELGGFMLKFSKCFD